MIVVVFGNLQNSPILANQQHCFSQLVLQNYPFALACFAIRRLPKSILKWLGRCWCRHVICCMFQLAFSTWYQPHWMCPVWQLLNLQVILCEVLVWRIEVYNHVQWIFLLLMATAVCKVQFLLLFFIVSCDWHCILHSMMNLLCDRNARAQHFRICVWVDNINCNCWSCRWYYKCFFTV